jgi:Lar family restriction alleviation protein
MTDTPLLPCPFCGGEAHLSGLGYCGPANCYDVTVVCDGCDAQTAALIVDQSRNDVKEQETAVSAEAAAAWNRRARLAVRAGVELEAVARDAVRDECGSQLCAWVDWKRICLRDAGVSFCLCENVGNAVLAAIVPAVREECARVADRFTDDETRRALGHNATIAATQIAAAIRTPENSKDTKCTSPK